MSFVIGFNEQYGNVLKLKNYMDNIMTSVAYKFNFDQIQIPIFEYTKSYDEKIIGDSPWPEWNEKGIFKFNIPNYKSSYLENPDIEKVLLIPEGTVSITRWLGNKLDKEECQFPIKLFYNLTCYRNELIHQLTNNKKREFNQFGFEILGTDCEQSDCEILNIISNCLVDIGVKKENIRIRINDISIYLKLCKESNISDKEKILLKEDLDFLAECKAGKHSEKFEECYKKILDYLKSHNLSNEILFKWETILNQKSGEIPKEFYSIFGDDYKKELDELTNFKNEFKKYNLNLFVDLCVIRSHEYYTGLSFEIDVVDGEKKYIEIGGGGRFDRLVQCFISDEKRKVVPCTGFAFGTERVLSMLKDLNIAEKSLNININYSFNEKLKYSIPENDSIEAYLKLYNNLEVKKSFINIYINKNKNLLIKEKEEKNSKEKIKIVKGARDFLPFQMTIRNMAFDIIINVFKKHGAVEIDTPVFELKEILIGKYGEDTKLIYDLKDQGGEEISLRYDLTVPLARYMAVQNLAQIKRYQIGKVYRRDQPQKTKGRFREFYQCDFDIAGSGYGLMIPEVEVLKVTVEILNNLDIGKFYIKLNHRMLLSAITEICGIDQNKFYAVCSSIDKLDKETYENVEKELINKGIKPEQAKKLLVYSKLNGKPKELLEKLKLMNEFIENSKAKKSLEELEILFEYINLMNIENYCRFDLSLSRGLDYYTGLIYEAVLINEGKIGSICGGGRYDNLIGMFSSKKIPSVGVSIGIERIFGLLEEKYKKNNNVRENETEILVVSIGKINLTKNRLEIINKLWDAGIKAEILYEDIPKLEKQMNYALSKKIPYILFIGEDEIKDNRFKLKKLKTKEQKILEIDKIIEEINKNN